MKVLKFHRLLVAAMVAVTLMMVACGSKPDGNGGEDTYPMPTMQEECVNHLYDVLMSPEGRAMTGVQLAVLNDTGRLRNVFCIDLPVSEANQLPRMGIYRAVDGNTTFEFLPLTAEDRI